jgi:hypothetical protein
MKHACGLLTNNLIHEIHESRVQGGGIRELRNLAREIHIYEGYDVA